MQPTYRTDVPLLPRVLFLYIQPTNIFNYFFLYFLSPSSFIPPQNVAYFLMLPFLVHKIFTFYINVVLNCRCPALGPKGQDEWNIPSPIFMPAKGLLYLSYVQPEIVSGCKMYTCIAVHLTHCPQLLPLMDSLVTTNAHD